MKDHNTKCPDDLLLCPYGCGEKVKRKEITHHYNEDCRNKVLDCEYTEFGCSIKVSIL